MQKVEGGNKLWGSEESDKELILGTTTQKEKEEKKKKYNKNNLNEKNKKETEKENEFTNLTEDDKIQKE